VFFLCLFNLRPFPIFYLLSFLLFFSRPSFLFLSPAFIFLFTLLISFPCYFLISCFISSFVSSPLPFYDIQLICSLIIFLFSLPFFVFLSSVFIFLLNLLISFYFTNFFSLLPPSFHASLVPWFLCLFLSTTFSYFAV